MDQKHKIVITRRIPESGIQLLKQSCEVYIYPDDDAISKEVLLEKIKDADGLLCLLSDPIDSTIIDAAPRLKVISNYAVGYNNIDVAAATARGIAVTNTPGVLTDATADLAWSLLLAVTRRIAEGDLMVREGRFEGWGPMLLLGRDLKNRTLGIIGAGRIGTAMAERSRGWNMKILYYSRSANTYLEKNLGARRAGLAEVLEQSDFVSLHLPLTRETRHLIDEAALRRMKPGAFLINTARGPVVDEAALVRVLREGTIAGAGLDVYENEPQLAPGLAELDNVVLAPHTGSATIGTRDEMAEIAARNILEVLEGRRPPFPVNPEIFESGE